MKHLISPLDISLLRVPLLPVNKYIDLISETNNIQEKLIDFYSEKKIKDALAYMSVEYFKRVMDKLNKSTLDDKDICALIRYASRFCFRSTPIGFCSSVSSLRNSAGCLPKISSNVRIEARLDEALLIDIISSRSNSKDFGLVTNSTIHKSNEKFRYLKFINGDPTRSKISEYEGNDAINFMVVFCSTPRSISEIISAFSEKFYEFSFSHDQIISFIDNLVEQQILTSDHLFSLSSEGRSKLVSKIDEEKYKTSNCIMSDINSGDIDFYDAHIKMGDLFADYLSKSKNYIVVDSYRDLRPCEGIPEFIISKVKKSAQILISYFEKNRSPFDSLTTNWESFYGDTDVYLMDLLNDANGLYSLSSETSFSIINDLPEKESDVVSVARHFKNSIHASAFNEKPIINIGPSNLIGSSSLSYIKNLIVWCKLWRNRNDDPLIEISSISFANPGRLYGRFCSGDGVLNNFISAVNSPIDSAQYISAELVFHPRTRIANVCAHPKMSQYEISIRSGVADGATQIDLSDIIVCNANGFIRLRSHKYNKWIHLTISNAHNHTLPKTLNVYRFLVDVISQCNPTSAISPRNHNPELIFSPRIVCEGVIVELASWLIYGDYSSKIVSAKNDDELIESVSEFSTNHNVPRFVIYTNEDNSLLIDLKSIYLLKELQNLLKKNDRIILKEYLGEKHAPFIVGEDGDYTHEILVPFDVKSMEDQTLDANVSAINMLPSRVVFDKTNKSVFVADQWIYISINIYPAFQDKVLIDLWSNLVSGLLNEKRLDRFFFVRYFDDNSPSLRIRLRVTGDYAYVMGCCSSWLHSVAKYNYFTNPKFLRFLPEFNRYGGLISYDLSVEIFSLTSAIICNYLLSKRNIFEFSVASIDYILNLFSYNTLYEKYLFAEKLAIGYAKEFKIEANHKAQIAKVVKSFGSIQSLKDFNIDMAYLEALESCCIELVKQDSQGKLCQTKFNIVSSILHMHINRLFANNPRIQEAILWEVLRRIYRRDLNYKK